jgi:hypothetical protein
VTTFHLRSIAGLPGHSVMAVKSCLVLLSMAMQPLEGSCSLSFSHDGDGANPIRRVVSLLQHMQSKVQEDGKREEEAYSKFMCFCKTGNSDLSASISAAEQKTTQDTSSLEAAEALSKQLSAELSTHKADRADAKDALAKATTLREREASIYAKDSSDTKTNIAALGKAITAIEKGAGGSFLQTSGAVVLRRLTIDMDLSTADRDILSSFLAQGQAQQYVVRSGEITGILKEMKDTMEKQLADLTSTEEQAVQDYNGLVSAKTREVAANTKAIESKTARSGRVGLEIVSLKEDLDDTTKALLEDRKFLMDLDKNCGTKTSEWEERSKTRAEELVALADTIRLLNDDDALELFKKALPSPSLIQMKRSAASVRRQAVHILKSAGKRRDPRMDMVMLALSGHAKNFDQVLKMIDNMVALLGVEQQDDDKKKAFCESEIDKTEDHQKELSQAGADLDKSISDAKESIATVRKELASLASGVAALDKSVADATEIRKAENAEYKQTMAEDQAAKELIGVAKNRLMKFYNPALYVPPAKVELSAQQRIAVNMGSEAAPTVAPSGIAGTGITYLQSAPVLVQVSSHDNNGNVGAPPPPPETWGAYQKKGQEQSGVVAMMELLVSDLEKEMSEMKVNEKDAQAEYETFMEDSRAKRAADSSSIAEKEGAKAELESELQQMSADSKATLKEGMTTAESLKDLHLTCDWLLSSYQVRKQARAGEIDSLKKAKAVLSGADFSLVQRAESRVAQLRGTASSRN